MANTTSQNEEEEEEAEEDEKALPDPNNEIPVADDTHNGDIDTVGPSCSTGKKLLLPSIDQALPCSSNLVQNFSIQIQ